MSSAQHAESQGFKTRIFSSPSACTPHLCLNQHVKHMGHRKVPQFSRSYWITALNNHTHPGPRGKYFSNMYILCKVCIGSFIWCSSLLNNLLFSAIFQADEIQLKEVQIKKLTLDVSSTRVRTNCKNM